MTKPVDFHTDADRYQLGMGSWSKLLALRFVAFIGAIKDGDRVLDVGCGTGSLTFAIAETTGAAAIVGLDRSVGYLDYARAHNRFSHVSFENGDARKLPFDDATFDCCVSALMIQYVPDAPGAVKEMVRVTQNGGIVATSLWDSEGGMELSRKFWEAAAAIDPNAKRPAVGPHRSASALAELWRTAGIRNVKTTALTVEIGFSSFDDYWRRYSSTQGPAKPYLMNLSEKHREILAHRLRSDLLGGSPDGPMTFNAKAWAVKGNVP